MFPDVGVPFITLPVVVDPPAFMALCTRDWPAVPEYALRYVFGEASGQAGVPPMSTTQWLVPPNASRNSGIVRRTGSADDRGAAPPQDNTGSADGRGDAPPVAPSLRGFRGYHLCL